MRLDLDTFSIQSVVNVSLLIITIKWQPIAFAAEILRSYLSKQYSLPFSLCGLHTESFYLAMIYNFTQGKNRKMKTKRSEVLKNNFHVAKYMTYSGCKGASKTISNYLKEHLQVSY